MVGANVPISIQVHPAAIVRNVLFALEHFSSVTVLSLKGASEGGRR